MCHGNCTQGRECDCVDNIEEHAEFQHHEIERLTRERDEARAEVERLRSIPSVDGVVVPREPTEGMWMAFMSVNAEEMGYRERFRWEGDYGNFVASYWAMMKAARREG